MNPVHGVEERLRECACIGERDTVESLIRRGVNINSQHKINGWTALHWAACRGHKEIVAYLLSEGADPSLLTKSGESAAQLCSSEEIKAMLTNTATDTTLLQNGRPSSSPPRAVVSVTTDMKELSIQSRTISTQPAISPSSRGKSINIMGRRELLVKVRIANSGEEDFIEVELDRFDLTYESLLDRCCEELELSKSAVKKIRKLPNILIRKDKDLQRLIDHQELEVVLLSRPNPNTFDSSYY